MGGTMITGVPIANGDGSYTFQTDSGEPLVLRGEAAARVASSAMGAAPASAPESPLQPSGDLIEAAAPGQDLRTADASDVIARELGTANPGATHGPLAPIGPISSGPALGPR